MADPLAPRSVLLKTVRAVALPIAVPIVMLVTTGCLYWARAAVTGVPGPRVADALPLDELAGHGSIPLLVYVASYLLVGCLLGLLAKWLGTDRLTAGIALAAGAGVVTFGLDSLSLFIVRQTGYGQALTAAGHLQTVYLTALAVGIGGALLGRERGVRARITTVLAWAVGLAGLLDLVSAIAPRFTDRLQVLDSLVTTTVPPVANALVVPVGVVLLFSARRLARGSRRAWRLAVALLAASSVLHLLKGLDYEEAIATGLLALALVAKRRDFSAPGSPEGQPRALLRLVMALAVAFVYGFFALFVNRTASGLPFDFVAGVRGAARAMVGLAPRNGQYLNGDFAAWFSWSVVSIVAIGVGWSVAAWVAPWRDLLSSDALRRNRACELVRQWGTDSLASFSLRHDKSHLIFSVTDDEPGKEPGGEPAGEVLFAYRVVRGVALLTGDPIGPPAAVGPAMERFVAEAHRRGWYVALLGASERYLDVYRAAGLKALYHGDEAVVNVPAFSLEGGAMRTVRQAVHRVERWGYRSEVVFVGDVSPELRSELLAVELDWLKGRRRTGFVMQLDDLFSLGGHDALFVVGRSPEGRVGGFLHAAVCGASASLSLSSVPRRDDTPNGLAAWLITETIRWADAHSFESLSLNFAPFAGLLRDDAGLSALQRLEREALLVLKRRLELQLDNLSMFNRKFSPTYQRRYVVYERRSDLPRVAITAMAAEGYLPFSALARGRNWDRRPAGTCRDEVPFPSELDLKEPRSEELLSG
ncbi:MAG: phosphatidylglycerol lysyltransferase domain-containing protein [Acidimicrobiales bacterium]